MLRCKFYATTLLFIAGISGCLTAKEWTFVFYIAAQNNLHKYVDSNIQQILDAGKMYNVDIAIQIDKLGDKKIKRLVIDEESCVVAEELKPALESTSGTPESLYNCVEWAYETFPSKRLAIIVWGHGTGPLDPEVWKTIFKQKGIAFNDTDQVYLTTPQLHATMAKIKGNILGGKNIDIVGFDACLMSGAEICSQIHESVDIMIASQESIPGRGWNYGEIFAPFLNKKATAKTLAPTAIATNIVEAFQEKYEQQHHPHYTLAAIDLQAFQESELSLSLLFDGLTKTLKSKTFNKLISLLFKIRTHKKLKTSFHEHTYIDLMHFLQSLEHELATSSDKALESTTKRLMPLLDECQKLLYECIIANVTGSDFPKAHGISVYYPESSIHDSYGDSKFAVETGWIRFLIKYLSLTTKKSYTPDQITS